LRFCTKLFACRTAAARGAGWQPQRPQAWPVHARGVPLPRGEAPSPPRGEGSPALCQRALSPGPPARGALRPVAGDRWNEETAASRGRGGDFRRTIIRFRGRLCWMNLALRDETGRGVPLGNVRFKSATERDRQSFSENAKTKIKILGTWPIGHPLFESREEGSKERNGQKSKRMFTVQFARDVAFRGAAGRRLL